MAAQATTSVSGGSFSATIPARSLVTYVIPATSTSTGNTVTVSNPGNQTGTTGTAVSLPITAADSASGQTLSYTAAGLPTGLSVSSSTGLISGTPTAGGTFTVTVTATDGTGATGSATFTWTVSGPARRVHGQLLDGEPMVWRHCGQRDDQQRRYVRDQWLDADVHFPR